MNEEVLSRARGALSKLPAEEERRDTDTLLTPATLCADLIRLCAATPPDLEKLAGFLHDLDGALNNFRSNPHHTDRLMELRRSRRSDSNSGLRRRIICGLPEGAGFVDVGERVDWALSPIHLLASGGLGPFPPSDSDDSGSPRDDRLAADGVSLLLEFGAHANLEDTLRRTPAHLAALRGSRGALTIEALFTTGKANLRLRDTEGKDVLTMAERSPATGSDSLAEQIRALLESTETSDALPRTGIWSAAELLSSSSDEDYDDGEDAANFDRALLIEIRSHGVARQRGMAVPTKAARPRG
jgi:hypothetical protein